MNILVRYWHDCKAIRKITGSYCVVDSCYIESGEKQYLKCYYELLDKNVEKI